MTAGQKFGAVSLAVLLCTLLVSASTSSVWLAHCCGVVFGVVAQYWHARAEREAFDAALNSTLTDVLKASAALVESEQKKREDAEVTAAHYRRLYLQKVSGD